MTWGRDSKAEPDGIVQSGPTAAAVPDPGKRSRTQGPNYTGSAYADHGAVCAKQPDRDGCFLPKEVRDPYIIETTQRIQDVGQVPQRACDVVRLERLMTPATQPSFVVGILFDVTLGVWTGGIIERFAALRSAAIQRATAMEIELSGLMKMEATTLNAKLATAVSKVKGLAVAPAGNSDAATAQTFIGALKNAFAVGFQTLRESIPASATDIELIGFHEAFDIQFHPQDAYQDAINRKIDRYLASGVTNIGRQADTSKKTVSSKEDGDPYTSVDTRVAWAKFASGYPPQLVYEHAASRDLGMRPSDPMQFGDGGTGQPNPAQGGLPGAVRHSLVPQEFAELAIQRHIAMWGGLPGFVDVDDSQWYWDMPRAQAAYRRRQTQQSAASGPKQPDAAKKPDAPVVVPDALKLKPEPSW